MTEICIEAAKQNKKYRENILKTDNSLKVEAIPGHFLWSSGVTHAQTRHINPDLFQDKIKWAVNRNTKLINVYCI